MNIRRKLGKSVYLPVTEIADLPQSVNASLSQGEHVAESALLLCPTVDSNRDSYCFYVLRL